MDENKSPLGYEAPKSGEYVAGNTDSDNTSTASHQEVFGGAVTDNSTTSSSSYDTNTYYAGTSPYGGVPEETPKGFAIASLVMGILSLCCCGGILFSILGIIFFCVQPKDSAGKRPTQATVGLILSIVGLVLGVIGMIFSFALLGSEQYQEMMRSTQGM